MSLTAQSSRHPIKPQLIDVDEILETCSYFHNDNVLLLGVGRWEKFREIVMAKVAVKDIVNVRFAAPDLEVAERFLRAFGLATADRSAASIFSRGTDEGARCHVVDQGDPRFVGAAFLVESVDDLASATSIEGASAVEPIDEPGGGLRVRLTDPDGFRIELVHGVEVLPAIPVQHHPINTAHARARASGAAYRRPPGPAQVKRLGHFVVSTPDVKRSRAWYRNTLGLLGTDDVFAGDQDNIIATFNRLARGEDYVDHHVFMAHSGPTAGLNHIGFEVQDYDDIFFGHYFMKEAGFEHRWGVGRHRLGSQVYNQWTDPWGRGYEHWTDSDVLNDTQPLSLVPASEALRTQWGDPPPTHLQGPGK